MRVAQLRLLWFPLVLLVDVKLLGHEPVLHVELRVWKLEFVGLLAGLWRELDI